MADKLGLSRYGQIFDSHFVKFGFKSRCILLYCFISVFCDGREIPDNGLTLDEGGIDIHFALVERLPQNEAICM